MARTSKPITVTLGELQERVYERVETGEYASVSEVLRAGLRALDREEVAIDDWLKRRVAETMADPDPGISLDDAFAELRLRHQARLRAEGEEG